MSTGWILNFLESAKIIKTTSLSFYYVFVWINNLSHDIIIIYSPYSHDLVSCLIYVELAFLMLNSTLLLVLPYNIIIITLGQLQHSWQPNKTFRRHRAAVKRKLPSCGLSHNLILPILHIYSVYVMMGYFWLVLFSTFLSLGKSQESIVHNRCFLL